MGSYDHKIIARNAELASAAGTEELIWNKTGAYVFPVSARRMEIASSDAKDVIAGVGARTVMLDYLDGSYAQKHEIVRLGDYATNKIYKGNGTTVTVGTHWKNLGKHASLDCAGSNFVFTPTAKNDGIKQDKDGATIAITSGRKYLVKVNAASVASGTKQLGVKMMASVPTNQVETATVVGTITVDGNARVIVTGNSITGSPITRTIALAGSDDATAIAGKIIADLQGVSAITDIFTVGGSTIYVTFTSILDNTNDAALNISIAKGTCVGLTDATSSANTTPGQAVVVGEYQVETQTIVGTVTLAGDCSVVVTGALVAGTPLRIPVALALSDTAAQVAGKIRTALGIAAITGNYTVSGADAEIILTANAKAANDTSLNIAFANVGSSAGLTDVANAVNTQAGIAPVAGQNQVETATVIATISTAGNAKITVISPLLTTNPQIQPVAVALNDDAPTVADKIKTALGLVTDITNHFTIGGTGADVVLTTKVKLANDATLNIAVENDTCVGITADTSSTDTTVGIAYVAGTAQIETITAIGTLTTSGNVRVILTSALTAGSPLTTLVPVVAGDTASDIGGKIRSGLGAVGAITTDYAISGSGANVILTALVAATDDATLDMSLDKNECTGLTEDATSVDTTAGIAANAGVYQVETATAAGTITLAGDCSVIVTSAIVAGSPLLVPVVLAAADTASDVGGKIRTALGLIAAITTPFGITGAGANVILTAAAKAADEPTLNISITKAGTCVGLTDALTSANTTPGASSTGLQQVETATVVGDVTLGGKAKVVVTDTDHAGTPFEVLLDVLGTKQVETATVTLDEDAMKSGGNATVIVTCTGMTGSPKTISVALAGTKQVETATAVGTITLAGKAYVILTSKYFNGMVIDVPVLLSDNASAIALAIRTRLAALPIVTNYYDVSGATDKVILTAIKPVADDTLLNIGVTNGTCTGITEDLTSADTTPGVEADTVNEVAGKIRAAFLADANIAHVTTGFLTVGGTKNKITLTAKTCVADVANLNINIADGTCDGITTAATSVNTTAGVVADTAIVVGGRIRTALALYSDITDAYEISGANANIILTSITRKANDTALNIAIDNYTCTGLTAAPTSVDTTAGIADGADVAALTNFDAVATTTPSVIAALVTATATAATAVFAIVDTSASAWVAITLDDIMLIDITALEYDGYTIAQLKSYFATFIDTAETTKRTINSDIFRANGLTVLTTGTELDNAGNISLTGLSGVDANVYAYIVAGKNISTQLVFTVPLGKTYTLSRMLVSALLAAGCINKIIVKTNYNRASIDIMDVLTYINDLIISVSNGTNEHDIRLDYGAGADILVMTSGTATAAVNCTLFGSIQQ